MHGQSVASLVHDVLRSAREPLTVHEVLMRVMQNGPVRTADPLATVRGALSQGGQLVKVGDGRFGYLPWVINGSLLRLTLTADPPTNQRLAYTEEVRLALFPNFFEIQKRKLTRKPRLRLSSGDEVELTLEHLGNGRWGSRSPARLQHYLATHSAAAADSLLIRVIDGEAGVYEASFELRQQRNDLAVQERNRALAQVAENLIRRSRSHDMAIWDVAVALLARGAYRLEPAPDPIEEILAADERFACDNFGIWRLAPARARRRSAGEKTGVPTGATGAGTPAADLLAIVETLGERVRSDPAGFAARADAPAIVEASRMLQELLDRGSISGQRRRRGRHSPAQVYQVRCTLRGIKPPIWRRLLVPSDIPLQRLHQVLQAAIGWSDSHLHEFVIDGVTFAQPDVDWSEGVEDEREVVLADVASSAGARLLYRYDFGDGWECDLVLERVLDADPGAVYPLCVTGKRAGPPEDVGGVWGYADLLEALSNPKHPQRRQRLEWIGGRFDAERFDASQVNARLSDLRLAWN